jgi:DNA repair ATPase RecN
MVAESKQAKKHLYNTDYHLWVVETIKQLQNREFEAIDWENLIDEVSDLSRREKRRLESLLTRLFEHLLKLKYWESEKERNQGHWQGEITNFQIQIQRELKASPSLKRHLSEIFEECYQAARKIVRDKTQLPIETFPENPIAELDKVLDENWLPE